MQTLTIAPPEPGDFADATALFRDFGFHPIPTYGDHPYEGTICFGRIV